MARSLDVGHYGTGRIHRVNDSCLDSHANRSEQRHSKLCDTCIARAPERIDMPPVSLRLPDDVSQRLHQLASRTGRTKTYYMLEAIREHLDDLEDLYLAEQRLIDFREGRSEAVPLAEVMKRYGLEDRA